MYTYAPIPPPPTRRPQDRPLAQTFKKTEWVDMSIFFFSFFLGQLSVDWRTKRKNEIHRGSFDTSQGTLVRCMKVCLCTSRVNISLTLVPSQWRNLLSGSAIMYMYCYLLYRSTIGEYLSAQQCNFTITSNPSVYSTMTVGYLVNGNNIIS